MGCCGQNTTGAGAVAVDTGKRVNYAKGMLLGVDDFVQEQAWHIARRHELAREVLGYGTVRGLTVSLKSGPLRVAVAPGLALMPSGTPVCVPAEQCCDLARWVSANWGEVGKLLQGRTPPVSVTVYAVLAYDSCLTDTMPVPGEPCRSEEDLTVESRIADCFKLELRLAPPDQVEENAVRDFADWIAHIPIDTSPPALPENDFLEQLRTAGRLWLDEQSPHVGDFMFGSPPASLASTDRLLRAALRLWATELRPRWRARYGCGPDPVVPGGPDDAVLLAALDLKVSANREVDPDVRIVEDARPVLLSLRMVQELIAQNPVPEAAQSVVAADRFGLATQTGLDSAYARADHTHGTPVLSGDANAVVVGSAQQVRVVGLQGVAIDPAAPTTPGHVLTFGPITGGSNGWSAQLPAQAVAPGAAVVEERSFGLAAALGNITTAFARADHSHGTPALAGDVSVVTVGTAQQVRVGALQGFAVSNATPVTGQMLAWDGAAWRPTPLPAPAPAPTGSFVEREAGVYRMVAAGHAEIALDSPKTGTVRMRSSYSVLGGEVVAPQSGAEVRLLFTARARNGLDAAGGLVEPCIVKLTPIWHREQQIEFSPYLVEEVRARKGDEKNAIEFEVRLRLSAEPDKEQTYGLQIEVSRFASKLPG